MITKGISTLILSCGLLATATALAAGDDAKPRMRDGGQFASLSGFEGQEELLGKATARAIREISPDKGPAYDFTGREAVLGNGVATVIRTMNVREPYQHEMNDALVKMTLTFIQFAKDNDLLDEMLNHEVRTQMPMLVRVGNLVRETGNTDFALMAMTDRTACFYQLAMEVRREPGMISFRNPFSTVLAVSHKLGQHDLTDREIHDVYIKPGFERKAELMGVKALVSEYREDGWITLSIAKPERTAAAVR
jgi:hypothetical protein